MKNVKGIVTIIIAAFVFSSCTIFNGKYYRSYTPYSVDPQFPNYQWDYKIQPGYKKVNNVGTRYYGGKIYYGYENITQPEDFYHQ